MGLFATRELQVTRETLGAVTEPRNPLGGLSDQFGSVEIDGRRFNFVGDAIPRALTQGVANGEPVTISYRECDSHIVDVARGAE